MRSAIIFGYYGNGNMGDEAILSSLLDQIKKNKKLKNYKITIASNDPEETIRLHFEDAQRLFGYTRLPLLLYKMIKEKPIIILGGGGILYGDSVQFYSLLAFLAKLLHLNFKIVSVSVGPYLSYSIVGFYRSDSKFFGINRFLVKFLFETANYASVRDELSRKILINSGVRRKVFLEKDLALSLKSVNKKYAKELLLTQIPKNLSRPYIGLNLRYIPDDRIRSDIIYKISVIIKYIKRLKGNIIFLPMGNKDNSDGISNDVSMYNLLKKEIKTNNLYLLRGKYHPKEMKGIYGQMDLVIGMRLHSVIFSYSKKIPVFAIAYESKVVSFCSDKHIPFVDIYNIDEAKVINFVTKYLKH